LMMERVEGFEVGVELPRDVFVLVPSLHPLLPLQHTLPALRPFSFVASSAVFFE
jgi:hypothetical protein